MSQVFDRRSTASGAPTFDKIAVFEPGRAQPVDIGTLTAHPDRLEFQGKHLSMTFEDVRGVEYS